MNRFKPQRFRINDRISTVCFQLALQKYQEFLRYPHSKNKTKKHLFQNLNRTFRLDVHNVHNNIINLYYTDMFLEICWLEEHDNDTKVDRNQVTVGQWRQKNHQAHLANGNTSVQFGSHSYKKIGNVNKLYICRRIQLKNRKV